MIPTMSPTTAPPRAASPAPAFSAHDLLRVAPDLSLSPTAPSWVRNAIARAPWLVVRRAPISDRKVPVGVRGSTRSERHGDHIDKTSVLERVKPEDLVTLGYGVFALAEPPLTLPADAVDGAVPGPAPFTTAALRLARALAPIFHQYGLTWGPTGSVGFECASGIPTATAASDLDLIIRCEHALPVSEASSLLDDIERVSISFNACRVDANIETPYGAISLSEYARTSGAILMRTSTQPRLTQNPWSAVKSEDG